VVPVSRLTDDRHPRARREDPGWAIIVTEAFAAAYEQCGSDVEAIQREKTMKHWIRRWQLNTIEAFNPDWRDLWFDATF
jgi:hypothetical protein